MTALRLWWLLRKRRSAGAGDPAALTSLLAVIAFAATSAVALVVVGGLLAFIRRARSGEFDELVSGESYVVFSSIATMLLVVPLSTLGAAAARLATARRDTRLAALRLSGATTAQVTLLTLVDTAVQAASGALIGIAGYAAVLPLVVLLTFQGKRLAYPELWVGVWPLLGTLVAVVLVALASATASLRRVAVTPLGVVARQTRPGLKPGRLIALVIAVLLAFMGTQLANVGGLVFVALALGAPLALGMATLNLVGPLVLQAAGRRTVRRAKDLEGLLAGRRILADPRAAWRSVGGVALATFIAGGTAVLAMIGGMVADNPADVMLLTDLMTGGMLTLVIAGVLAAVSTGVAQSARIIDQREEYRNLVLAGTDTVTLDRARLRETSIPLAASVGTATVTMVVVMAPLIGINLFMAPKVLGVFLGSVLAASALVLAGAWGARLVAREVVVDV